MPRLNPVNAENASAETKELLNHVQTKLGMTPNIMRTMANSAAVLQAYLGFGEALAKGSLSAKLREQIALTVAEVNECGYCLAAHSAIGQAVGLSNEVILDSRRGTSVNNKDKVALQFAKALVDNRGIVDDSGIAKLRDAGYSDGEIAEIVANVTHNIFTNYFNHVAETAIDFPHVEELANNQ